MTDTKPLVSSFMALSHRDLVKQYNLWGERLHPRVLTLTPKQLDTTFSPESGLGEWSCRAVLGHIADGEIAFTHRMRRAASEERPQFSAWDENAFIRAGVYSASPASHLMDVIRSIRTWTGTWLGTLPESAFERTGLHPERGEQTIHAILAYATWHVEHHGAFLERKLHSLLG